MCIARRSIRSIINTQCLIVQGPRCSASEMLGGDVPFLKIVFRLTEQYIPSVRNLGLWNNCRTRYMNFELSPTHTHKGVAVSTHNEHTAVFAGMQCFIQARRGENVLEPLVKRPHYVPYTGRLVETPHKEQRLLHPFPSKVDTAPTQPSLLLPGSCPFGNDVRQNMGSTLHFAVLCLSNKWSNLSLSHLGCTLV